METTQLCCGGRPYGIKILCIYYIFIIIKKINIGFIVKYILIQFEQPENHLKSLKI